MIKKSSIAILAFILILAGIELDIFLPTLSIMQIEFQATDTEITSAVTANLIGFALSTFFYGSLSDSFGRRPVIIAGLFIFFLGSLYCYLSTDLKSFLLGRFIQGVGCGAPLTICFIIVLDSVPDKNKSTSIISLLNSFITGATTLAPILGAYIGSYFSWRSNFALLTFGAFNALWLVYFFLDESLPFPPKGKWEFKKSFHQYFTVFISKKAWHIGLIPILMYSALLIYLVNFPLIAPLTIPDIKTLGYLQSFVMLSFVVGSILASFLISKIELQTITWIAYLFACGGGVLLLVGAFLFQSSWYILTFFMSLISIGIALIIGLYMGRSLDIFPELRGIVTAFQGALRLTISSFLVMLSSFLISENFAYLSVLICLCLFGSLFLCMKLEKCSELTN